MFKKFYLYLIFSLTIFSLFFSTNESVQSFNSNLIYPTTTKSISSYFGYRELFGSKNFHNGIDFPAPQNSKIFATLPGVITSCGFTNGYGICITILHQNGKKSLYGHMSENIIVKIGQNVSQGECIGYVGPKILSSGILNGWTTGPHLHFSIFDESGKAVDPLTLEYN